MTRLDRASYQRLLSTLRDVVVQEHELLAGKEEEEQRATDAVLVSALPMLGEEEQ